LEFEEFGNMVLKNQGCIEEKYEVFSLVYEGPKVQHEQVNNVFKGNNLFNNSTTRKKCIINQLKVGKRVNIGVNFYSFKRAFING